MRESRLSMRTRKGKAAVLTKAALKVFLALHQLIHTNGFLGGCVYRAATVCGIAHCSAALGSFEGKNEHVVYMKMQIRYNSAAL